jgi:hypothetical protein
VRVQPSSLASACARRGRIPARGHSLDSDAPSPAERRRYPTTTPRTPRLPAGGERPAAQKSTIDEEKCESNLISTSDPFTGAPRWQVITRSRQVAITVAAVSRGTARRHGKGEWQASIPQAFLLVIVTNADAGTLWCRLSARPSAGVFSMVFAPWSASAVLGCPVPAFPARGRLSVRDVRVTTRMGRTVRYVVPEFAMSGKEAYA